MIKYRIADDDIVPINVISVNDDYVEFFHNGDRSAIIAKYATFDTWEEAQIHIINNISDKIGDLQDEVRHLKAKRYHVMSKKKPA